MQHADRPRPTSSDRALRDPARGFGAAIAAALLVITAAFEALPVRAESQLRLPLLAGPAGLSATTFEPSGRAVGRSSFEIETLSQGVQKMRVKLAVDTGGENLSEVTLAPVSSGPPGGSAPSDRLRIVEQRSQSTRADGKRLDLLVIDHVAGRASCIPDEGGAAKARHVTLPDQDRVVNVPMQLLFQPLVTGQVEEVRFQIVLCSEGPKLQDMIAVRGPRRTHEGREIIEVRYGPDFGSTVAFFASRLLPSFSFWFDAKDGAYLGHRMPLHTAGPEVVLVRSGLTPSDLGVE